MLRKRHSRACFPARAHGERAAAIIEFSLTLPLFVFLLTALLQFLWFLYSSFAIRFALQDTARWALLDQQYFNQMGIPASSRAEGIRSYFLDSVAVRGVRIQGNQVFMCPLSERNCGIDGEMFNQIEPLDNQVFRLTARTTVPSIVNGGQLNLRRTAFVRTQTHESVWWSND